MNRTTWHEQGRRAVLPALALAFVTLAVFFCPAQLLRFGFEECEEAPFEGPYGGGAYGGSGGGRLVAGGAGDFVRSGKQAVRLEVWDDGSKESVAWAGIMQTVMCDLRRKVQAGVWLYFSSSVLPLQPGAQAHLRVEYFEDPEGTRMIPGCVYVSPPLDPGVHASDTWHLVEVHGRIPPESKSLRVSVVVMGQGLKGQPQAIWVDDLCVEMHPIPRPGGLRKPGRASIGPARHYACCTPR